MLLLYFENSAIRPHGLSWIESIYLWSLVTLVQAGVK